MENESGKKPTHVARDNSIFDIDQRKELIMQVFYMGHSSISRSIQNLSSQCLPCGYENCLATPNEILKLLKEIGTKRTLIYGIISLKLAEIAVHILCSPFLKPLITVF